MDKLPNHKNVCTYDDLCGYGKNPIPSRICDNCKSFSMHHFSAPGGKCLKKDIPEWADTFAGDVCDLFEADDRLLKEQQRIRDMILEK